jgi:DNA ligase 1
MLSPDRVAQVFGLQVDPAPDSAGKEQMLAEFLGKDTGLNLTEQLECVLGDPFLGNRSTVRRNSLVRLLMSMRMISNRDCLDRLTQLGDVALLFAEHSAKVKSDPPLSSAEVLRTLRFLPSLGQTKKFNVLRSLFQRCGRLEAYFLAKLLLQKAGFGSEYQGPMLARLMPKKFRASADQVAHAMALTDIFHVADVLQKEGVDGLRKIQLQPLVPVRPTLAGGSVDDIKSYPVWVERKYDGIRLMLHKSTDARGSVLCGAYTRNRGDWLEQIRGLDATIRMIPAQTAIIDGELFGTVLDIHSGSRPASVYEVYAALQGEPVQPVNLKYAAFDIIYLNGMDLTGQPLMQRRQMLSTLVTPVTQMPTPISVSISEGQLAGDKNDVNRLFQHCRAQGYEGVITKDQNAPYLLATRDPNWKKRKPEITLDLAVTGACFSVSQTQQVFGSFVIAARNKDGTFEVVGDVAGVDKARENEIQHEIMRDGLMTGERIERPSASGARPGIGLRPSIVVTVKFEGIARDQVTDALSLRDPKVAVIRSDKSATEADTVDAIQEIYLRQRVG